MTEYSRLDGFVRWLEAERGLSFDDYETLWQWSVSDLTGFWSAIWEFFDVQADGEPRPVLVSRGAADAEWFPRTSLNYAEHVFAGRDDPDEVSILYASELRELGQISWGELRSQVGAVAAGLRDLGVERGDSVVAYAPNIPEAAVALLAAASLGAVWAGCSPDRTASSAARRFAQLEPKVLIAVDGYRKGGRDLARQQTVAMLSAALPSLRQTVVVPYLHPENEPPAPALSWTQLLENGAGAGLGFQRVPFSHPLWALHPPRDDGTAKAVVHGHGGILLEHLKALNLQLDCRPGDRLFWSTAADRTVWNLLVSGLLTPAAAVLYDGDPNRPDPSVLWDLAERARITSFGTPLDQLVASMEAGVDPGVGRDLGALRAFGATDSSLGRESLEWVRGQLGPRMWDFSGLTSSQFCTFVVGGVATPPGQTGERRARAPLGVAVEAWSEECSPISGEVGDVMIAAPMPSAAVLGGDRGVAPSPERL